MTLSGIKSPKRGSSPTVREGLAVPHGALPHGRATNSSPSTKVLGYFQIVRFADSI